MFSEPIKKSMNPEERSKSKNLLNNGIVRMNYIRDKKLYEYNTDIRLFGNDFFKKYRKNCKMIIKGKEYEMEDLIKERKLKEYGINQKDRIFEVKLKGERIRDMSSMFFNCGCLIKVDFSSFNTENVTDMNNMFCCCYSLTQVNLSQFNTQNVTDMKFMFFQCLDLVKLDLSTFNTKNVIDMSNMFGSCIRLYKLNLSSFNTQNVKKKSNMFFNCYNSLIRIKRSKFNKVKIKGELGEAECKYRIAIIEI